MLWKLKLLKIFINSKIWRIIDGARLKRDAEVNKAKMNVYLGTLNSIQYSFCFILYPITLYQPSDSCSIFVSNEHVIAGVKESIDTIHMKKYDLSLSTHRYILDLSLHSHGGVKSK